MICVSIPISFYTSLHIQILKSLTTLNNSAICVEHNLEIIKAADHLIELGPHGGEAGGEVLAAGQVASVAAVMRDHLGERPVHVFEVARR